MKSKTMLDITLLILAIGVSLAHGIINLVRPEIFRKKAVNRLSRAVVGLPLMSACAVLLVNERWWLLLILNGVCYAVTAPFMATIPLRVWTIACSFNTIGLIVLGPTR